MITIKLRRDTSSEWLRVNPVLDYGEPGYENDTGRLRIGDGRTRWASLDYYVSTSELLSLMEASLANAGGGDGGAAQQALASHISSLTPHPAYDDGPSLFLLYQNAKV